MKRKFTGSCIPTASELGKILLNTKEFFFNHDEWRRTGKTTMKISKETKDKIDKL
jgi:hypothetical protein